MSCGSLLSGPIPPPPPVDRLGTREVSAQRPGRAVPILTICPRPSADVSYYFRGPEISVADARWIGRGCAAAGVPASVDEAGLAAICSGREATTGRDLPTAASRMPARSHLAYDAVFSTPKSVSVLAALGPPGVVDAVGRAHEAAVATGFAFLEGESSALRRTVDGRRVYVDSAGFAGAAFRHLTSRAGDPHLHDHVVFANFGSDSAGRWSAFNSAFVWASARTAGFVYDAALRNQLTDRLGLAWLPVERGMSELQGVPRKVIDEFSTRSRQVSDRLGELGREHADGSTRMRRYAAWATRRPKPREMDPERLRSEWSGRAGNLGFGPGEISELLGRARSPRVPERIDRLAEVRLARSVEVRRSERSLARAAVRVACDLLPPAVEPSRIFEVAELARSSALVRQARSSARERGVDRGLSLSM